MQASHPITPPTPPFLRLPLELRRQIYHYLLPVFRNTLLPPAGTFTRKSCAGHQGLLTANRQLSAEVSSMLYRDFMIPISVYTFGSTAGWQGKAPLEDFDFAKVRTLRVHIASREIAKCVADLRKAALDLCGVLWDNTSGIEYLQLDISSFEYYGCAWLGRGQPLSSLVEGLSDLEVVTQPFRTIKGIPRVDVILHSPRLLSLASVRAWKFDLEQTMMSTAPCTDTDLLELSRFTVTAEMALEHWKMFKRFDELWEDSDDMGGMYESERESYLGERERLKHRAYSDESEFSVDEPGCRRRKREYFTYRDSETESDKESDGGGKEKAVVGYRDGIRLDKLCS
ncbi:MAG: hypothetical protein Q9187_002663 [Circinaria calcarea]